MRNAERAVKTAAVKTARKTGPLKKAVKTEKQLEADKRERQDRVVERIKREDCKAEVFVDFIMSWAKGNMCMGDKRGRKIVLADEFLSILLKIVLKGNVEIYEAYGECEEDFMPAHLERVVNALTDSISDLRWSREKAV